MIARAGSHMQCTRSRLGLKKKHVTKIDVRCFPHFSLHCLPFSLGSLNVKHEYAHARTIQMGTYVYTKASHAKSRTENNNKHDQRSDLIPRCVALSVASFVVLLVCRCVDASAASCVAMLVRHSVACFVVVCVASLYRVSLRWRPLLLSSVAVSLNSPIALPHLSAACCVVSLKIQNTQQIEHISDRANVCVCVCAQCFNHCGMFQCVCVLNVSMCVCVCAQCAEQSREAIESNS